MRAGLLLAAAALAGCASPNADPAATGGAPSRLPAPRAVRLTLEGLPPDTLGVLPFMAAFRAAFGEVFHPLEAAGRRRGAAAEPVRNPFRLAADDDPGPAYQLHLVIDWLPAVRESREADVRVTVAALSPEAAAAGARPLPRIERLRFRVPRRPASKFYGTAGRGVALLGIEALHRAAEELPDTARLRIDGAERRAPSAR